MGKIIRVLVGILTVLVGIMTVVLLAGCADKTVKETAEESALPVVSAEADGEESSLLPELNYSVTTTGGPAKFAGEEDRAQGIVTVEESSEASLKLYGEVMPEKLREYLEPKDLPFHEYFGSFTFDRRDLPEGQKIVVRKGLVSEDGKELKETISIQFTGVPELRVEINRLDEDGGVLPNNIYVTEQPLRMRLRFSTAVDRDTAEQSVKDNIFPADYVQNVQDKSTLIPPKLTFDWASDAECVLTAEELRKELTYSVDLSGARGRDGSKIMKNHNYFDIPSYPFYSIYERCVENFAYWFYLVEPQTVYALNLADGKTREVYSIGNAFERYGPVSENRRYLAVSPVYLYWDWLCDYPNWGVLDTQTGRIRYDAQAFTDHPKIDNDGKLYRNGYSPSPTGSEYFEWSDLPEERVTIRDGSGKALYTFPERPKDIWWLDDGRLVYQGFNYSNPAANVIDTKGSLQKTVEGYALVSVSPNGAVIAVEKDNIIELYRSDWTKISEIDIKALTGRGKEPSGEEDPDIRNVVRLYWGKGKLCLTYYSTIRLKSEALLWDYVAGAKTAVEQPKHENGIQILYYDSEKDELVYTIQAKD